MTMCSRYPPELKGLTPLEEAVIARAHPCGTILKLNSKGGKTNLVAYNAVRGHVVTIPQEVGPLLNILPSRELQFHDYIRVVWNSDKMPTAEALGKFVSIDKTKVLRALTWLCQNNPLYKDVTIDKDFLDSWEDGQFVPQEVQDSVVKLSPRDSAGERGTYAGAMDGSEENDLHDALGDMADGTIASGAVYTDIDGERQNPTFQMLVAMFEMIDASGKKALQQQKVPVLTYKGRPMLMKDYDNPEYFPSAFPTLFPYGRGGDVPFEKRSQPISLEAWGKWTLSHHSRRYAVSQSRQILTKCSSNQICSTSHIYVFAI